MNLWTLIFPTFIRLLSLFWTSVCLVLTRNVFIVVVFLLHVSGTSAGHTVLYILWAAQSFLTLPTPQIEPARTVNVLARGCHPGALGVWGAIIALRSEQAENLSLYIHDFLSIDHLAAGVLLWEVQHWRHLLASGSEPLDSMAILTCWDLFPPRAGVFLPKPPKQSSFTLSVLGFPIHSCLPGPSSPWDCGRPN